MLLMLSVEVLQFDRFRLFADSRVKRIEDNTYAPNELSLP